MFGIDYETWKEVCKMYFDLKPKSQMAYLQWYPFAILSTDAKIDICSEEFFYKYIDNGAFVMFPPAMHCSENYIQKGDGSFRPAVLVSPIIYLVLQCMGKKISRKYKRECPQNVDVFYAGNYPLMRAKYKQDYDDFYKDINSFIEEGQYFLKTDITSFFSNINLDKLIDRIDAVCNKDAIVISQSELSVLKELLSYCGDGRFPLIENSMMSSYLATEVYLDEIDKKLDYYLSHKVSGLLGYKMIRYVDDLYILISTDLDETKVHELSSQIINEYSSILKEYGLSINSNKCCLKQSFELNDELKKSLYDEFVNGEKYEMSDLCPDAMNCFLNELLKLIKTEYVDIERYNQLINKCFSIPNVEFTPSEIYNYCIYENSEMLKQSYTVNWIIDMIQTNVSYISLDPKRLAIMVMKTESERAIKSLLNQLFKRSRSGLWNSYDTTTAIAYLLHSDFRHIDLLKVLADNCPELKEYYFYFCKNTLIGSLRNRRINRMIRIINSDSKAYRLYFMYLIEEKKHNNLAAFSYYKNFFDRITANIAFAAGADKDCRKPNYNKYYKESEIKKIYDTIQYANEIIAKAHKLRNANPLAHSSAELMDREGSAQELKQNEYDLQSIVDGKIMKLFQEKDGYS